MTSAYDTVKNERDGLLDIVELKKSVVLIDRRMIYQPAGYYTYWSFTVVGYAGYVSVDVHNSTTDTTFVQVIYSAYSVNFDDKTDVGMNGKAVFPVLPTDNVQVRIGNMNLITGATETITVTYYY